VPIVVDSSIAACWLMPDEFSEVADQALERISRDEMLVPALFWFELRNVLVISERRKRITWQQVTEGLIRIDAIPYRVDGETSETDLFDLARRHKLTVYDAAYLELAVRTRSAIATLDRSLASAAAAEGMAVIG
jgi:predicted nucleic acid-binding protein